MGGECCSCCCCWSSRRLPDERLMLTRVREPVELVVEEDRGGGEGTKTGGVMRGRRVPPSSFLAVVGLVGLRTGGGLRTSRSNEGRDEPMLPEGMAMSSNVGCRTGGDGERAKVKDESEGGAERGTDDAFSTVKGEKVPDKSTDCLSFRDRRRRCMLSLAL